MSRFKVLSFFLMATCLLAACGGTLPQTTASRKGPKVDASTMDDASVGNAGGSDDGPDHDTNGDHSGNSGSGSGDSDDD